MLCLFRDNEDLVAARRQLEAAGAFVVDALRRDGRLGRTTQGCGRRRLDAGHMAHIDEEFVAVVAVAAHEVQDGTGLFQIQILAGGDVQVVGTAAKEIRVWGRFSNLGMVAPVVMCFVEANMP